MAKIFCKVTLPADLIHLWLQHLRNFDVAHPGCHFEVGADVPEMSIEEMIQAMKINPELSFSEVWRKS